MKDHDHLTDKQRRYVENISRGMPSRDAAKAAGYSASFSKVAAHRLKGKPEVAKAIESIRAEGRTMAVYGLVEAMKEADDAAAFAKLHKNPMANVKACELRAKLSGLLIDHVEIVTVDLTGALSRAEARVLHAGTSNGASSPLPLPTKSPIHWGPRIAGDGADPEAGPPDGE